MKKLVRIKFLVLAALVSGHGSASWLARMGRIEARHPERLLEIDRLYPAGHLDWAAAASCQPRRQPAVDQGGGGTGLQGTGGSMDLAVFCSGRSTGREVREAGRDREAAGAGAGSLSRLLAAAWGRRRDLGEDTRLALAAVQELPFR